MSRLDGPRRRGPFARLAYWMAKREYGKVPEPLEVTAHHPGILRGYSVLEWETGRASSVDTKLKDLAGTKAAVMVGCAFCIDIGSALSTKAGASAEQLADLPRYRESEHFDETEKLVLDYAVAITSVPVVVPDELFDALRARFDERQLVELTSAIATENYRARFNWAFGIGSQGFAAGGACALPEPAGAQAGAGAPDRAGSTA
jgi:AhpD family alkylhydroperoxidase